MGQQLLVLAGLAAVLGLLVAGGRLLALRSRRRLAAADAEGLWAALGAAPDGRPTVVAFSTPSCAACRGAQQPALEALQARAGEAVRVLHVDAAERPEAARAFGILTVPATVVLDAGGRPVASNQGFAPADRLARQIGPIAGASV